MDISEWAKSNQVKLRSMTAGSQKVKCPKCSSSRKSGGDPCLSVRIDKTGLGWRCHHCGWSGGEFSESYRESTQKISGESSFERRGGGSYGSLQRVARSGWKLSA